MTTTPDADAIYDWLMRSLLAIAAQYGRQPDDPMFPGQTGSPTVRDYLSGRLLMGTLDGADGETFRWLAGELMERR